MRQTKKQKPRTRLAPEVRRAQILDHTARLVVTEGMSAVTMGRVAEEAGVSKALVYTYFSTPVALLQAIVKRDMERIQEEQAKAATSAKTFPQLVRNTTHVALNEARNWGPLLQRLMGDPQLAKAVDPVRARESTNVKYLTKRIADAFELQRDQAQRITQIALGLTIAAAEYLQGPETDTQEVEDLTVAMIEGAVRAGAAHHGRPASGGTGKPPASR